eukprot:m51a1_g6898 hypothetical protein (178) ;mRNA; r:26859-29942
MTPDCEDDLHTASLALAGNRFLQSPSLRSFLAFDIARRYRSISGSAQPEIYQSSGPCYTVTVRDDASAEYFFSKCAVTLPALFSTAIDKVSELVRMPGATAAAPKTLVVVFFAGHGVQKNGENFLIDVDTPDKKDESRLKVLAKQRALDHSLATGHQAIRNLVFPCLSLSVSYIGSK